MHSFAKMVSFAIPFAFFNSTSALSFNADTPLQCMASLESKGATIQSKFVFDGINPTGTSFNHIQTYNISVYKYLDENSQERVGFTASGSISGSAGFVGYPVIQPTPWIVTFVIKALGTVQVTCERI